MFKQIKNYLSCATLLVLAFGCNTENTQNATQFTPEITAKPINIKIQRLDQDLFALSQNRIGMEQLGLKYGNVLDIVLQNIMGLPAAEPQAALAQFFSNKYISQLYGDTQKQFGDLKALEQDFSAALSRYQAIFPKQPVPRVTAMLTGFAQANALTDSGILVGLDMFLGKNYRFYPTVQAINAYQRHRLTPEYIVPNSVYLLSQDALANTRLKTNNLLENMVYQGKMLYISKAILPNTPDSLLLGYTAAQTDWITNSEGSVWAYTIENELIYTTQQLVVSKFMNDAPFTAGLPKQSPPRLGRYVGWQIVKNYMKKNPEITIPALINTDAQLILNKSGYKPQAGLK